MERCERAWEWLETHGAVVHRQDLHELRVLELMDVVTEEERRVRALAEEWEVWHR